MGCSKATRNQYYAALSANLVSLSYGASFGWISSSYLQLQQPETGHLATGPLTKEDLGWVTSAVSPGGLIGVLFFGCWFPIAAYFVLMFSGSCGVLTVNFVVIAEITPPKIRCEVIRVHMLIDFVLDMSIATV
ncbi:hypothetical protein ACLKA7_003023 [Drosophila subpalustris]